MTLQQNAAPAAALTLPAQLTLDTLNDERLRVREPIAVVIFKDDEGFTLAEAVELNEFGFGDNPAEAFTELQYAIADLYFSLEEDKHRLGPDLQAVWEILQVKVAKR